MSIRQLLRPAPLATRHYGRLMAVTMAPVLLALSATPSRAELPPDAQAAVKDGLIAAQQQQWDIAVEKFDQARNSAPDDPVLFGYLGLAESKIPGRELRAMAWFGAYLAANPHAANAASVRDTIASLRIKSEADINRLISTLQDAAVLVPSAGDRDDAEAMREVAWLWGEHGNIDALKTAMNYELADKLTVNASFSTSFMVFPSAMWNFVRYTSANGDFAAAQRLVQENAAALSSDDTNQCEIQIMGGAYDYGRAQAFAGNIAGAQATMQVLQQTYRQIGSHGHDDLFNGLASAIVTAQLKAGNIVGAQASAEQMIENKDLPDLADQRADAELAISIAQLDTLDMIGARRSAKLAQQSAELIGYPFKRVLDTIRIAEAQAEAGDIAGAKAAIIAGQALAVPPGEAGYVARLTVAAESAVAKAQVKVRNLAGARQTIALAEKIAAFIPEGSDKDAANRDIALAQAISGDVAGAQNTVGRLGSAQTNDAVAGEIKKLLAGTGRGSKVREHDVGHKVTGSDTTRQQLVPVHAWIVELEKLNAPIFLDRAAYLRTLPADNAKQAFDALAAAATKIVQAQKIVEGMLQRQSADQLAN